MRWQLAREIALTAVVQEEKEMNPWGQHILFYEEKSRNGMGMRMDNMENENGTKTDIPMDPQGHLTYSQLSPPKSSAIKKLKST